MYNLSKQYKNHYGLDLKSSDLDRNESFASDMLNAQYKKDGSLEKRKGYQVRASGSGGHGLARYNKTNALGNVEPELLSASDTLKKLTEATMEVSYTGSASVCEISLYYDPDVLEYKCQILEDTTLVLDRQLGVGFDEGSIDTITALSSAISALTDFTATVTGSGTIPSAFLTLVRDHSLLASSKTFTAYEWVNVNSPLAAPLAGSETNKDDANFENVSFAQLSNVLFCSNGYDELQKYDGQNLYRAGVPAGIDPSVVTSGGGTGVDAGDHTWYITYEQIDAVGNIVEGEQSPDGTTVTVAGGGEDMNVTVNNILAASGFNTNCGIVAGAQVSVNTIALDDGAAGAHTLLQGDTAYFFDSVSGGYVTREITSVTAGSITIAGAWRTQVGGTFSYLVAEIPNDSFTATQVYLDNTPDANVGAEYIEPIKTPALPPKGKYITEYYNQLIVSGNADNPNYVYWSDITSPEHFPTAINFEIAESKNGDPISGVKQSNEVLAVFEESATHVYNGDFTNNTIRHDIVSHSIGCVAHHTIQQVESQIYFLSTKGVYSMVSGQIPVERSNYIQPAFIQDESVEADFQFKYKRALAVTDTKNERYLCLIPTESSASGGRVFTNDNYIVFVEDYSHNASTGDLPYVWLKWRYAGSNITGGAQVFNDKIHFVERRYSTFNDSVDHNLGVVMNLGDAWDYQDNNNPIELSYSTAWYSLGEPSVFKKWVRLKIFAVSQYSSEDVRLDIKSEIDYINDLTKHEIAINLNSGGSGYGLNPYGLGWYGDIQQPNFKTKLGAKAKSLRLIWENTQDQKNLELTGWELEIAAPFMPRIID
jgi:hypothetical protein